MFRFLFKIIVILALASSCIRYVPRPIDPPRLEQSYRARTLADPNLEEFLKAFKGTLLVWPPQSMDLDTLTLLALYFSLDLDSARARLEAAQSAIVTANVRRNPSFGGAAGYTDSEASPYAFRLDPNVPFETAGKRTYRTRRAQQLAEAAQFSLAETAWSVRSRLRAALADHLISNLDLDQLIAESQIREELVGIYEKRLEVGEASNPIVSLARTDLARVQVEIEQVRGRIAQARAAIAGLIGLPPSALEKVQLTLANLENPPSEEVLDLRSVQRLGLLNRLDVQRLLSEYDAAETDLQLQIARQKPDIALGPAYSFGEGANTYVLGPALLLPLFDRNKGAIAESSARRTALGAQFLSTQAKAIDEMERALAGYRSALRELDRATTTLGVIADREEATRRQLEAGEADRLAVTLVRLESAVARRSWLAALRRAHTALGGLEDAVQHPLAGAAAMPAPPAVSPRQKEGLPQ